MEINSNLKIAGVLIFGCLSFEPAIDKDITSLRPNRCILDFFFLGIGSRGVYLKNCLSNRKSKEEDHKST